MCDEELRYALRTALLAHANDGTEVHELIADPIARRANERTYRETVDINRAIEAVMLLIERGVLQ